MNDLKNKYAGTHQPRVAQEEFLRQCKLTQVSIRMPTVGTESATLHISLTSKATRAEHDAKATTRLVMRA